MQKDTRHQTVGEDTLFKIVYNQLWNFEGKILYIISITTNYYSQLVIR